MNTPIFNFVKIYAQSNISRMHMPAHKGQAILGCENLDITEISGADVLYSANGIINDSENNASTLFGTAHSYYSTQGSSLAICAMLCIIAKCNADNNKCILAARNIHKSFVNACSLLGFDVDWIFAKNPSHICSCDITTEDIEKILISNQKKYSAVYVTSPDYLGNMLDISAISKICDKYNLPLLVDNAHGAYTAFLDNNLHPINCGAVMCADSAHKTLPVLTGGAYLHISKKADKNYLEYARFALSAFASTSPSYLTLQSLDICNDYLENHFRYELKKCIERTEQTKHTLKEYGYKLLGAEPLKIVIYAKSSGYFGHQIAKILRQNNVECEFADDDFIVLMTSPKNCDEDFSKISKTLLQIPQLSPIQDDNSISFSPPERALSMRQAFLSAHKTVKTEESLGKICAASQVSCPPAVPIIISGEIITQHEIKLLKKYGIEYIDIIDT